MRAVRIAEFDQIDAATIEQIPAPTPGPTEVVVDVKAVAVNYVDLVTMRGAYQFRPTLPYTPGKGPAGVVRAVGSAVETLGVGDRVLAMAEYGGHAEQCLIEAKQVYPLPEALSFEGAAAMAVAFDTAWMALVERGRLQAGETVLVLGASGAVGGAAVQIARALGAKSVLAGITGTEHAERVRSLGATHLVEQSGDHVRDTLRDEVLDHTDGHGADVVIDMMGGSVFDGAVRAVAWRGRLVVVGFAAGRIPELRMNYPLLKNIEISGLQISDYRKRTPDLMRRCFRELFDMAVDGRIAPPSHQTFSLDQWHEGVGSVARRATRDRILLCP